MAKLELQHLRKKYSAKVVPVKDVSLTVGDGQFLTLLGPSGCGKSTLLRLIAGLEQPTEGKVIIGGKTMNHVTPGDRNIAMVFQSYALYPHMSVAQNIGTALKLQKFPDSEIKQRVSQVASTLGLEQLLERKPGQLSGGQRQRVALARALVRNPQVFLLDEPLSNLDALLREQVRSELKQLFRQQNKPVVYVTHDQTEAMTLSSQVAVLYQGLVQQLDTPNQIYGAPANQFVASFVGSPQMNLLTLPCQKGAAVLGNFKVALPQLSSVSPEIVLGIRPEDVRLANSQASPTIAGRVTLVEELGKEKLVSVQVEGTDTLVRALLPTDRHWEGERLTLVLPAQQIHWFDSQTGDRLDNPGA